MDETAGEYRGIWAVAEQEGGRLTPAGARLLGVARALADNAGASVTAALLGGPAGPDADAWTGLPNEAIAYGADTALLLRHARLESYDVAACAAALAAAATAARPSVILLADGPAERELAPRLARRLGSGLISAAEPGLLDVDSGSGAVLAGRREWSGRLVTTYAMPTSRPQVVTVRVGAALNPYADDWRYGATETADLSEVAWPTTVVAVEAAYTEAPAAGPAGEPPRVTAARALRGARRLVVAGRGVGGPEGLAQAQRLAAALGSEWAATPGAVEAGWAPPEREISLYGVTVRPDLYIGCGVSGAAEHVVAMQQARTIVAINSDPQAPIFRWAHYGVVADCAAVLEQLLQRLERG